MVVGHLAVGLSAKRLSRNTSLVWFITAANLVDLIWPLFLLIGRERVRIDPGNTAFTPLAFEYYPWTHSLLAGAAWGVAFAVLARACGVSRLGAMLAGALVMSHWILDLVTHRPDLPLSPWSDRVYGFGLWRSIPATLVVETLLWIAGIMRSALEVFRGRSRSGRSSSPARSSGRAVRCRRRPPTCAAWRRWRRSVGSSFLGHGGSNAQPSRADRPLKYSA